MNGSFTVGNVPTPPPPPRRRRRRGHAEDEARPHLGPGLHDHAQDDRREDREVDEDRHVHRRRARPSRIHNAHVIAPGFNRVTKPLTYTGTQTWKVKLARTGTFRFLCDPHALTGMKGSAKIVALDGACPRGARPGPASRRSRCRRARRGRDRAGDALGVHALEAAPRHLRRDAVALLPRRAEAKRDLAGDPRRVQRRAEQRGARQVVARVELELAEEVAPVRRERPTAPRPSAASERGRLDGSRRRGAGARRG